MNKEINNQNLSKFKSDLQQTAQNEVLKNAVNNLGVKKVAQQFSDSHLDDTFSLELETGSVSNQKRSGRCWLFSTLTNLRTEFAKEYKVKDFELSQNYLSFYDRLEKANFFFKNVIETAHLPKTDRKVALVFQYANDDGGQWQYSANLVKKYGVVPSYVMPETYNSENTSEFSSVISTFLRKKGIELRSLIANKANDEEISNFIAENMSEVYRICVYAFGEPVQNFDLMIRDDDKKIIEEKNLTPKSFFEKYFDMNLDDYVSIMNTSQEGKEFNKTYTIETQGNIVGMTDEKFLNKPIERLKELAIKQMQAGETVWFGNDVGAQSLRKEGVLAGELFNYDAVFDIDTNMNKANRLDTREGEVSHAMVLTGVNIDNEKPTKWKVENSWGEKVGNKGYFVMDDKWFEEFVYEVVINKKYLTDEEIEQFNEEPIVLPGWDAMA
ncbi:aminopeptidase C [Companilactobacillus sp. RD055328]|uniref:C1 family peptidase n=1 Tax=Companilactobacillus sp. RD055328 TaxID=2916634 RepID=UPI001FC84553|nr:C1 family peptidase [Companilactobacillus sp. RD055328]GKQ43442.1 aminopeptidase C [Companilactobacillus sp. RD055328]